MCLVRGCVDSSVKRSDRALALIIYKVLWAKVRHMEKTFGFSSGQDAPKDLPKYKAQPGAR